MATGNVPVQPSTGPRISLENAVSGSTAPTENRPVEVAVPEPPAVSQALVAEDFSKEQFREVAAAFTEVVGLVSRGVRVRIDDSSNQIITQVIDQETDEVIRQIPPQELLDISQRLRSFVGTLLDQNG